MSEALLEVGHNLLQQARQLLSQGMHSSAEVCSMRQNTKQEPTLQAKVEAMRGC